MRTHLFRVVLAVAVLLTLTTPALAQNVVQGKVTDAQGKPVEGATVVFEAEGTNRKNQTKSDKNGDFLQVGLPSGPVQDHGIQGWRWNADAHVEREGGAGSTAQLCHQRGRRDNTS